jgi:hypothetical protein
LIGHFVGLYAQMLHDNLFHPLANVTHRSDLVLFRLGCIQTQIATIAYGLVVVDVVETIPNCGISVSTPAISRPSQAKVRLPYFKYVG